MRVSELGDIEKEVLLGGVAGQVGEVKVNENEQAPKNPLADYWARQRAEEQRLQVWLESLKVGDEVAVVNSTLGTVATYNFRTVARATAQFFIIGASRYRRKDGREAGSGPYRSRLVEPTPELKREVADTKRKNLLISKIESVRWRNLPLETLRRVDAALEPTEGGERQ